MTKTNKETLDFIRAHADDDVRQLALRGTKSPEVQLSYALDQIAGRQTARRKLPTWAATDGIVYPPHLAMEQCSSEQTARYKAMIMERARNGELGTRSRAQETGKAQETGCKVPEANGMLVDLTGGFGVDFSFMARGFTKTVYVERQEHLCDIARENFQVLGLSRTEVVCGDAAAYLQKMEPVDVVYMDPARRDSHGSRTYGISDCTPDALALMPTLLSKATLVLLKLSPMLDWHKAVSDIGTEYVRAVHIVAVDNECKELLIEVCGERLKAEGERSKVEGERSKYEGERVGERVERELRVVCVNLLADGQQLFEFTPSSQRSKVIFQISNLKSQISSLKGAFLYEPNAAIMKAGCFGEVSSRFGVGQVAPDSHLFISERLVADFPGRIFRILDVSSMNREDLKEKLRGIRQANISVRNFPLSVADLRRRLKLSDGGTVYIFGTTLADRSHILLICER